MPNCNHIVREHLEVLRLPPEREVEIVEELALRLETACEGAALREFIKAVGDRWER